MSQTIINEISDYLSNPANLKRGLVIHNLYSKNFAHKRILATQPHNRKKLLNRYLRQILKTYTSVKIPKNQQKTIVPKKKKDTSKILSHLKKDFPKLDFSKLPNSLKSLVFIRYDAWKNSVKYHALLHDADTDEERFFYVNNTVEAIKSNWSIWEEINHYSIKNKVLGVHKYFKQNEYVIEINHFEKTLSVKDFALQLAIFHRRAAQQINRLYRIQKDNKLSDIQKKNIALWLFKYDFVSSKLNLPKWQEKN